MDSRAPAVVAVVVTTGPGPGLEATLASLVAQEYEELSILVVANGDFDDVPNRVAAVAPSAFVKMLDDNRGYGGACNEGALAVEGAAFFLFCHDDIRLDSRAVSQLVEAAYRTNAGIVTPKFVHYNDPLVLLHAGQVADRFGSVQERIEVGEIDHGQQDLERDVFVAPGGATLIRADLFTILRGFDPLIPVLGEDLDICWRAQVAGARIVVAPGAVVAHRETIATGQRAVTAVGTRRASRQDLQRRHQLLVVCTAWGPLSLLTTLPLLLLLDVFEVGLALVGRDLDRAGAIVGSWRWVLRNLGRIRQRRRQLRSIRSLRDPEIRRLQVPGSSRVRRFFLALLHEGLDTARGVIPHDEVSDALIADSGVGFGSSFGDVTEFDDMDDLILERAHRPSRIFTGFRSQALLLLVVTIAWLIGSRNLVAMHLPLIGRLAPLDSWWTTWRHFFASWTSSGVGTGTPGMPGYGVLGFAGTFVFGRMGVLPRAALIFAVPVGALGIARLLKEQVSNRARILASIAYLALPLGVNMIQQGRVDVLVVVAGLPYLMRRIFMLMDVPGFQRDYPHHIHFGHIGWRSTREGQQTITLLLAAVMTALAPATFLVVGVLVLGSVVAKRLGGRDEGELKNPWRFLGSLWMGLAILLLPMTVDTLLAGRGALGVFGLSQSSWTAPSFGALVRGADGSFGGGWGGWLLPAFAVIAILLSRGPRRILAVRLASVATVALLLSTLVDHHLSGPFAPDADVLLVVVMVAMAALVGTGVSSLENDLKESNFGWRQMMAAGASLVLVAAVIPFFAEVSSGRFNLPTTSSAESLSNLSPDAYGGFRVLWLANPDVLPLSGWSVEPGLAAATSTNGLPSGASLFTPPNADTSGLLLQDVNKTVSGQTVRLGQLLAPAGISLIVVMNSSAPSLGGSQASIVRSVPANLIPALDHQTDLSLVLQTASMHVYTNSAFHGVISLRQSAFGAMSSSTTASSGSSITNLTPILGDETQSGFANYGQVLVGEAPASAFALNQDGSPTPRKVVLGWVGAYSVSPVAVPKLKLVLHQFPLNGLLAIFTLGLWGVSLLGFGGVQRLEEIIGRKPRGVIVRRGESDAGND